MCSIALDALGRIWTWGSNSDGQLGTGSPAAPQSQSQPSRRSLSSARPCLIPLAAPAHKLCKHEPDNCPHLVAKQDPASTAAASQVPSGQEADERLHEGMLQPRLPPSRKRLKSALQALPPSSAHAATQPAASTQTTSSFCGDKSSAHSQCCGMSDSPSMAMIMEESRCAGASNPLPSHCDDRPAHRQMLPNRCGSGDAARSEGMPAQPASSNAQPEAQACAGSAGCEEGQPWTGMHAAQMRDDSSSLSHPAGPMHKLTDDVEQQQQAQAACMDIACGARHSAVVSRDGRLFLWGSSLHGQVGPSGAFLLLHDILRSD